MVERESMRRGVSKDAERNKSGFSCGVNFRHFVSLRFRLISFARATTMVSLLEVPCLSGEELEELLASQVYPGPLSFFALLDANGTVICASSAKRRDAESAESCVSLAGPRSETEVREPDKTRQDVLLRAGPVDDRAAFLCELAQLKQMAAVVETAVLDASQGVPSGGQPGARAGEFVGGSSLSSLGARAREGETKGGIDVRASEERGSEGAPFMLLSGGECDGSRDTVVTVVELGFLLCVAIELDLLSADCFDSAYCAARMRRLLRQLCGEKG